MRGVSVHQGELKLVSKRSEDREALSWSMTGVLVIYEFYTPTSERSHVSNPLPWKTKVYI